ncbi:hypothetical protein GFL86_28245 [Rhizobium laguerreae]|nr:hypothetical protein [Rhizobium laguerreae]
MPSVSGCSATRAPKLTPAPSKRISKPIPRIFTGGDCRNRPLIRLPPPSPRLRGEGTMQRPLHSPHQPLAGHAPLPASGERVRVRGSHWRQPDSSASTRGIEDDESANLAVDIGSISGG